MARASKDDVTTPAACRTMGVQIETIKAGDGATSPQPGQKVSCHYCLTLASGKKVDSGRSFVFTLGKKEVIAGFEEGITKMSVGQRAKLTISSDMGYGPSGEGSIPPNATLIIDVELIMAQ